MLTQPINARYQYEMRKERLTFQVNVSFNK